jgi:peptide/nickel transport system permease protein
VGRPNLTRFQRKLAALVARRLGYGVITLLLASMLVFLATQVLPGNAANAILGQTATPARVKVVDQQLHLNRPVTARYWSWLTGLLSGHPGHSYVNGVPVWSLIGPRLVNTLVLLALAALVGVALGVGLGVLGAVRRDRLLDNILSGVSLAVAAVPEYVVAMLLVIVLSVNVVHLFPATFVLASGARPWSNPKGLALPVVTLALVISPYVFRMTRASLIEALESDYVETARLMGLRERTIVLRHALPNALAPTIQVIGLQLLYLAGGVVVVEYVFNYPGIGQALVGAVSDRDLPTLQLIVVLLAAFYVIVNIFTDVLTLVVTPRLSR